LARIGWGRGVTSYKFGGAGRETRGWGAIWGSAEEVSNVHFPPFYRWGVIWGTAGDGLTPAFMIAGLLFILRFDFLNRLQDICRNISFSSVNQ
jgi:hypothetical protein